MLTLFAGTFIYHQDSKQQQIENGNNDSVTEKLSGALVILPVINQINDNDHQWVYLGAMDQLISRLKSNNKLVVLSTDYVLTVMK